MAVGALCNGATTSSRWLCASNCARRSPRAPLRGTLCFLSPGVDGAYIGTTFAHLFFMTFRDLVPAPPPNPYVPRIFGYRIHQPVAATPAALAAAPQEEQETSEVLELRKEVAALRLRLAQHEAGAHAEMT